MPRPRPPYPAVSGLSAKPTVINNVETLSKYSANNFRWCRNGSAVLALRTAREQKFLLYLESSRTGLVEVAMGTSYQRNS